MKPFVEEVRNWSESDGFAVVSYKLKKGIELSFTFSKNKLGSPKINELIFTSSGSEHINTAFVQKLKLGNLIELALREINKISLNSGDFKYPISYIRNQNNWLNTGNKPLPDLNYAFTAWIYEHLKTNGTKNVYLELAKLSNVKSVDTIKKRLLEAKKRGLLIKGNKGSIETYGGFVTNKGFTLIIEHLAQKKET